VRKGLTQPQTAVTFAETTLTPDEENSLKQALELVRLVEQNSKRK
jgi:hypothetical protein